MLFCVVYPFFIYFTKESKYQGQDIYPPLTIPCPEALLRKLFYSKMNIDKKQES